MTVVLPYLDGTLSIDQFYLDSLIRFAMAKPWTKFESEPYIMFEHPDSKESVIASVIGALGQSFGISIYPGEAGHRSFSLLMRDDFHRLLDDWMGTYRSISVEFQSRSSLSKRERSSNKELVSQFPRGAMVPVIMNTKVPEPPSTTLDDHEKEVVSLAANFLLELAEAVESGEAPREVRSMNPGRICFLDDLTFDRTSTAAQFKWMMKECPAPPNLTLPVAECSPDLKGRLQQYPLEKRTWMAASFLVPGIKIETSRFPPRCVVLLDAQSEMILANTMVDGELSPPEAMAQVLFQTIQEIGRRPRTIMVRNQELMDALAPACSALEMTVRKGSLTVLQPILEMMDGLMFGQR